MLYMDWHILLTNLYIGNSQNVEFSVSVYNVSINIPQQQCQNNYSVPVTSNLVFDLIADSRFPFSLTKIIFKQYHFSN